MGELFARLIALGIIVGICCCIFFVGAGVISLLAPAYGTLVDAYHWVGSNDHLPAEQQMNLLGHDPIGLRHRTPSLPSNNFHFEDKEVSATTEFILAEIRRIATLEGVDPILIRAFAWQESGYKPGAKSELGALGVMQLMPETAASFGVKNRLDPTDNIGGGVRYYKHLITKYKGNRRLAIAGYYTGEDNIAKNGGKEPSYTTNYVNSVLSHYKRFKSLSPKT